MKSQITVSYFKIYSAVCQLHLNKTGKKMFLSILKF